MAENQPRKAGEYERPATVSASPAMIIGIITFVVLVILAIVFFRH